MSKNHRLSSETPIFSLKTPSFSSETPRFYRRRTNLFIKNLQFQLKTPLCSSGSIHFSLESPNFTFVNPCQTLWLEFNSLNPFQQYFCRLQGLQFKEKFSQHQFSRYLIIPGFIILSITKCLGFISRKQNFTYQREFQQTNSNVVFELVNFVLLQFKGTDRLCKVVELSMQCCGQILQDSFETYKTYFWVDTLSVFFFKII